MRRVMFAVAALVLSAAVGAAQDPPPKVQPPEPKVIGAQPGGPWGTRPATAATLARLEEEVETLEANRDVKKAYLRAAEVGARVSEKTYVITKKAYEAGSGAQTDFNKAEADYEVAKSQVEIRAAELKEVEVKIKYAKKRLEEAKATVVRPAPAPKPADPPK